ncbi:MAG: ROK family protein [Ignavibacteria bacterium]|jgi:glucokinase|nr:ROK family protein [Ignavibacteria bacterium]MCU7515168.1 ROK family protein [Ignavibacteria bacterium]
MKLLGIDLGGTNVRVGLIEDKSLKKTVSSPVSTASGEGVVLNEICLLIDELMDAEISGIGVGVPSVVDVEKGIVYDVQNIPSWKEVHLKEILEKKYSVPVYINNDANCFAAGEKYFGKMKNCRNGVGVIMGTGLGAGIIADGRLYSGTNCGAGEFGMIPYEDGIFEHYCSGQFFKNEYGVSGQEAYSRAICGDKEALDMFTSLGEHIGNAIKVVLYTYDPEVIILGGSVSKAFSLFKESMWKEVRSFAYRNSLNRLVIEPSELEQVALLGAAALYYDAVNR